jgi:hypothetical protein
MTTTIMIMSSVDLEVSGLAMGVAYPVVGVASSPEVDVTSDSVAVARRLSSGPVVTTSARVGVVIGSLEGVVREVEASVVGVVSILGVVPVVLLIGVVDVVVDVPAVVDVGLVVVD